MTEEKMRCFDNIAKLIKTKRSAHPKNYSQSELSRLLGYKNGQFISNVERALCNIPLKMLTRVCDILNISPGELKDAMLADYRETLENFLDGKKLPMSTSPSQTDMKESESPTISQDPVPAVVINSTPFRT